MAAVEKIFERSKGVRGIFGIQLPTISFAGDVEIFEPPYEHTRAAHFLSIQTSHVTGPAS